MVPCINCCNTLNKNGCIKELINNGGRSAKNRVN